MDFAAHEPLAYPPFTAAKAAGLALLAGCVSQDTVEAFKTKHSDFRHKATWLAPVTFMASSLPEGTIDDEPGEVSFSQVLLDATVPIPQDEDSFLIAGVLAGVRRVDFEDVPFLADDDLHRYGLRLGYGRFVTDELMVQGYWQPSIYSDLDGTLNSRDYRLYYGTLLAVYQTSPTWYWKAGLALNDSLDTCVIPLGGFAWHFAERWSFQALLPRDATLVYANDPWQISSGLWFEADEYHVRSPDSLGLEHDVHVAETYAHLTVERSMTRNIALSARGGSTVRGAWDWSYGNGPDFEGQIEPDMFFAVGLGYRF
jgi:hypothetical protein